MKIDAASYRASCDLLLRDLLEVFEFVKPVSAHEHVYSHRLFALLLRACTDFESIAKDLLMLAGSQKQPEKINVLDYRELEPSLRLEPIEVRLLAWRPKPLVVFPFRGWISANPPLSWYADYNAVKHNRQHEFAKASLITVITATAGLLTVVIKASDFYWEESSCSFEQCAFSFSHAGFRVQGPK